MELIGDWSKYQGGNNRPEIVASPTKSNDDEKLPLITAHSNILDSFVQDSGFSFIDWI